MLRILTKSVFFGFAKQTKILVSNSNSIYFNLAFEEFLF